MTEVGTKFLVDCRGKNVEAVVSKTPFYRRVRAPNAAGTDSNPVNRSIRWASRVPTDLRYTKDHEWMKRAGARS